MKRKQLLLLSSLLIFTGCDSVPSSTSSNNPTSVVDETIQLKNEITTYLNSINVENYKDDEKLTLQSMISSLQELVSSSNDKAQLEAAFSAFKTKYLSLKTKAEYDQEEKENIQVQFDNRKKELLDELTIDSETQYRIEELLKIKENQSALLQKVNEATTIEQLNEISLTSFKELLSSSKTNAQYTMEEILPYGLDSDWGLVNAHRDQMTLESDGTIKTKDDGYALDRTLYKGKMEIVFSVNTNNYCNLGGILLTTKSSLGDGLDGYVINIARQSTFEYYQVYYLRNFYASKGTQFYQYIGGWVYNNDYPNETVSNNKMRVIVERDSLRLYKEEDYQKYGESAKVCPVDLTNGGQFDVYDSYHFGIVTWGNGGVPFNLELDMLAGSESVDGAKKAQEILEEYVSTIDAEKYGVDNKATIDNKISEVRNLTNYNDIFAGYNSLKNLVNQIDADWRQNSIDAKKVELLERLNSYSLNQFRVEELAPIQTEKNNLQNKINSVSSLNEINNISFDKLESLISTSKTNAQYTMEEILPYGLDSDWGLINAHRNQMTLESDGTIKTKDDGYALDSTVYNGDMEIVFSINTDNYCNVGGFLLANKTSQIGHNGLDGYLINIKRSATEEYYQIHYLNNGFNGDGSNGIVEYIGGWVYTNEYPNETVTNNKMRVIIKDGMLSLYKDADYLVSGTNSKHVEVDLTANNKYALYNSYHFGILTWLNGGTSFNFELDELAGNTIVNGIEKAKTFAEKEISKVDLSNYASSDASNIEAKIAELRNSETYIDILNKIKELKTLVASTPSKYVRPAIDLMDHIFSDDHSIKSSLDAVQNNMNQWTHEQGTNSVVNPGNAGWQLADDNFTNFRLKVNMAGATPINPFQFNGYLTRSFLIGAESAGDKVKGYAITVQKSSTECWIQLHYLDGNSDCNATAIDAWAGDYDGKDFTIEVINGVLKLYNEDGTQFGISFFQKSEIALTNYTGGHIGVFSWTYDTNIAPVVQTTMTFKELRTID